MLARLGCTCAGDGAGAGDGGGGRGRAHGPRAICVREHPRHAAPALEPCPALSASRRTGGRRAPEPRPAVPAP